MSASAPCCACSCVLRVCQGVWIRQPSGSSIRPSRSAFNLLLAAWGTPAADIVHGEGRLRASPLTTSAGTAPPLTTSAANACPLTASKSKRRGAESEPVDGGASSRRPRASRRGAPQIRVWSKARAAADVSASAFEVGERSVPSDCATPYRRIATESRCAHDRPSLCIVLLALGRWCERGRRLCEGQRGCGARAHTHTTRTHAHTHNTAWTR